MKTEIHPNYVETTFKCSCGATFVAGSTIESGKFKTEICSKCHPFFTGKQKLIDSSGRVDKFNARRAAAQKEAEKNVEKVEEEDVEETTKKTAEKEEKKEEKVEKAEEPEEPKDEVVEEEEEEEKKEEEKKEESPAEKEKAA